MNEYFKLWCAVAYEKKKNVFAIMQLNIKR